MSQKQPTNSKHTTVTQELAAISFIKQVPLNQKKTATLALFTWQLVERAILALFTPRILMTLAFFTGQPY